MGMKNIKNKISIFLAITILTSPFIINAEENIKVEESFCKNIIENKEKISERLKEIETKKFRFLKNNEEEIELIINNFGEKVNKAIEEASTGCNSTENINKKDVYKEFNLKINEAKKELQDYSNDLLSKNFERINLLKKEKESLFEKLSQTISSKLKEYKDNLVSIFK